MPGLKRPPGIGDARQRLGSCFSVWMHEQRIAHQGRALRSKTSWNLLKPYLASSTLGMEVDNGICMVTSETFPNPLLER